MKNLSDYEKTQSATVDLPCGAFKNESSPGQKDGTDILAEHIQDLAYPLYQVLQLAGEVPNGELEDGNNKKQFLQALCNIGFFKYSAASVYAKGNIVLQNIDGTLSLYRSLISNNNFDLSDLNSWKKLLTVENNNRINFYVETNIGGGSGSNMPVFCFNSGPVDENGEPALLTLDNNIITMHAPAVGTSAGGETFTVSEDVSIDISELKAGTYNIFYNPETNGLETYQNTVFWQKSQPQNWAVNDIWVDESVLPQKSYMKKSDTDFIEVKIVPNAVVTILSVGGGGLIVKPYNAFRCLLKSEFEEIDNNIVHKTGDETIKGIKIFANELAYGSYGRTVFKNSGFANITLQSTEIQDGVAPAASRYTGIEFRDKNNARIGYLGIGALADGRQYFDLQAQGNTSGFNFPKCTSKPTTISTAATNKVAVIIQNYVNGHSWFRVWSDGFIEQGGYVNVSVDTYQTITFLKQFTATPLFANYSISVKNAQSGSATYGETTICDHITTTGMNFATRGGDGKTHTRPGCWYAAGY